MVLLPRYLGAPSQQRSNKAQWALIVLAVGAGPLVIYGMFLSPRYGQSLKLTVVRVKETDTARPGSPEPQLEAQERALLDSLFPHARLESGMTGSSASGAADHEARMLIVVTGPLMTEARLRVPRGAAAVYVQEGERWRMFPTDAPTLKDRVRVAPGSRPNEIMFAWPSTDPQPITWRDN